MWCRGGYHCRSSGIWGDRCCRQRLSSQIFLLRAPNISATPSWSRWSWLIGGGMRVSRFYEGLGGGTTLRPLGAAEQQGAGQAAKLGGCAPRGAGRGGAGARCPPPPLFWERPAGVALSQASCRRSASRPSGAAGSCLNLRPQHGLSSPSRVLQPSGV